MINDLPAGESPGVTSKPERNFWRAAEWFAKNVLLPFLPPIIGSSVRFLFGGQLSIDLIDPGEIAFSLAMVAILVTHCTGQIVDRGIRGTVRSLFLALLTFFLMLFALSAIQRLRTETMMADDLAAARQLLHRLPGGDSLQVSLHQPVLESFKNPMMRARIWAIWAFAIVLPLTFLLVYYHKLHDE